MADSAPTIQVTEAQEDSRFPQLSPSYSPTDRRASNTQADSRPTYGSLIDGTAISRSPGRKAVSAQYASSQDTTSRPTTARSSTSPGGTTLGLDPLSQYINRRTSVLSPPPLPRSTSEGASTKLSPTPSRESTSSIKAPSPQPTPDEEVLGVKSIKKGVKFLGRIIGKKKDFADIVEDAVSERADERPEGAEAEVFCSAVDNIGFSPRHAQPPAYIKVRSSGKKEKEFNRMFLAQELQDEPVSTLTRTSTTLSQPRKLRKKKTVEDEAIWATAFSNDGRYLAAGGQDKLVRIWAVLSSPDDRNQHEREEETHGEGKNTRLSAPVFRQKTVQVFEGHSGPVLDLCWSKNNFLISTSMDKTVKLWHISRPECLCTFKHSDVVTSVRFHPKDDRFFLAGSLDSKLRLWSIPDKSVAYWVSVSEMITAVSFTPDGKQAIAGCLTGLCLFYETEGLRYSTSIHVRSTHGKNARGSKITGIQTITVPPENPNGEVKMLVTSNDSRIRLYNLRDKSLEQKFRGATNNSSQIQARFSSDARYIVCGDEHGKAFIWSIDWLEREAVLLEFFEAHNSATTVTAFAPMTARQRLGGSGDPVYDLCNPPPVTLLSKTEEAEESRDSVHSWHPGDDTADKPSPSVSSIAGDSTPSYKKPGEKLPPSYLSRAQHRDGNIIVTGSVEGVLKVFRQDCAWRQRQRALETASIFSKRLGRHSSLATNSSSLRLRRKDSSGTQNASDRVNNWRQNIQSMSSKSSLDRGTRPSSLLNGRTSSIRSISPIKEHAEDVKIKGSPKSSTWPLRPKPDTPSPPLPSLPLQGQISIGLRRNKQDLTPTRRPSRPLPAPVLQPNSDDNDDSSDESFNSADEEPQPQSSPPRHQTPPPQTNGTSTPPLQRTDSVTYWARDAWRDQVSQQLVTANQLTPTAERPGMRREGSERSVLTEELSSGSASRVASRPSTRGQW